MQTPFALPQAEFGGVQSLRSGTGRASSRGRCQGSNISQKPTNQAADSQRIERPKQAEYDEERDQSSRS